MSDVSPPRMPSFLGIGAARSGTTWLHENLRHHPQVWVPPAKELHYFDLLRHGPIYFNLPSWTPEGWSRGVQAIQRRHFELLAKKLGLAQGAALIDEMCAATPAAIDQVTEATPKGFPQTLLERVLGGLRKSAQAIL